MFVANQEDRIPLPSSLAATGDEYWAHLRVAGLHPWYWLRIRNLGAEDGVVGHLLALDEGIAELLEDPDQQLISLLCVYPHPERAPFGRAEVPIVEVWRAQDRHQEERPCILLIADDGTEYGGHPFAAREGLRRVRLLRKIAGPV
jgi:hypothetical protein